MQCLCYWNIKGIVHYVKVLCIEKMSTMDIFFATKSASHVKYFSVLIKYSAQTSSFKIRTIYSFHFEQFIRHISSNLFRSISNNLFLSISNNSSALFRTIYSLHFEQLIRYISNNLFRSIHLISGAHNGF
jgi:hypothetical protein